MSKKIIVRLTLGILILIFSFLSWSTLADVLNNGSDWLLKSIWSLAAFLVLGVFAGLAYLIENEKIFLYSVSVVIILPVLVFLKPGIGTAIVLAVAILFFMATAHRANFEKSLRIKFSSGVILRKGLSFTITGLALLVTLLFYWAPYTQSLSGDIRIPRPLFDAIAKPAIDLFLDISLPQGLDLKSSSFEFTKQEVEFLDNLYFSSNEQLSAAGRAFKKWIPLGVSVSIFFSFKVLGIILLWLMMLLAWLIFRILLWSGIVKIEKVAAEKEVIQIS